MKQDINIVIPMAGRGFRFKQKDFALPKPLIDVNGRTMIERTIDSLGIQGNWHFVIQDDEYSVSIEDAINKCCTNAKIIKIDYVTEGPACSALLFRKDIDTQHPLIIANCDQIMEWSGERFIKTVAEYDGAVVTYHTDTEKNSYASIDSQGLVTEIKEKQVISNISLNGIHYWRHGSYFVDSAEAMIAANDRAPNGEFYIGPSYNYMVSRKQIVGIYHIPNQQHHAVGVPDDLAKFIEYEKTKINRLS